MALDIAAGFLDRQLATWNSEKPLVVGISGPQGSGKSYLAEHLLHHLHQQYPSLGAIGISIDDFYLTHSQQSKVSEEARKTGNFVLDGRGLPGTHDVDLARHTLAKLCTREVPVKVPRYDKSAHGGQGDRYPEEQWQVVDSALDVIIFEGWFNGYRPIEAAVFPAVYFSNDASGIVRQSRMYHLQEINASLADYEALWAWFDCFVVLQTANIDYVYQWRLQQEQALVKERGIGMTGEEVARFVRRYMPMYELYYWRTCSRGASAKNTNLCIEIDFERSVLHTTLR